MRTFVKLSIFFLILVFCCTYTASAVEPHGGMMRYPDVSSTHIVFVYADDIWIVPRAGGGSFAFGKPFRRRNISAIQPGWPDYSIQR